MGNKELTLKIKGDSKGAEGAINRVADGLKGFADKLDTSPVSRMTKSVGQLAAGFNVYAAAAKAVVGCMGDLADAYETQRKAEIQLEVAARNNPYLDAGTVARLKDYASELQSIGTIGDEKMLPMMAKLAAAGRTEAEIQSIMSAALDMSASGVATMDSAVDALNKSLNGQGKALQGLVPKTRELTSEQMRNGDAIRMVADAYSGMSKEVAEATGATDQLKNAWGDFKELLGEGISDVLSPIKRSITETIVSANKQIQDFKKAQAGNKVINDVDFEGKKGGNLSKKFSAQALETAQKAAEARLLDYQMQLDELDRKALDGKYSVAEWRELKEYMGTRIAAYPDDDDRWEKVQDDLTNYLKEKDDMHMDIIDYLHMERYVSEASGTNKTLREALQTRQQEDRQAQEAAETKAKQDAIENAEKVAQAAIDDKIAALDLKYRATGEEKGYEYWQDLYETAVGAYTGMLQSVSNVDEMEQYDNKLEKGIKSQLDSFKSKASQYSKKTYSYTANKSGTTKDDTPKTMQDWVAEITAEVTKARDKLDADARLSGKVPSSQDKTDAESDAAFSAIVKVLSDPKFYEDMKKSGNVTDGQEKEALLNDTTIQTYLAKISDSAQWKEFTGAQNELSGAIKEFWENAGSMSEDDLVWAQSKIMEAYKAVGDVHRLTEKEQEDFNEKMKKLQEDLDGADSPEKEADVRRQILELQTQYHQLSIEEERMYGDTMNQLRDELAAAESQRIKDLTAERVEMGDQLMQGLGDSARQAGDMVKEYFENNRQADVAEQQKLYEDGAISYEEYCDRVEKIDKEAAQNQYKIAMAQWVIQLAQATSNIALGVTKAISKGGAEGIITGALVSAAGAVNIASIVASKPRPPSFETGGIVPGTSYTGDRVGVRVNSGEGVFTRDQMKAMGIMARTGTQQAPRQSVIVNNNAGRYAEASADVDQNTVRVTVAEIMHSELRAGNMTGDIQEAQAKARGARYL